MECDISAKKIEWISIKLSVNYNSYITECGNIRTKIKIKKSVEIYII